jgi:hypothetical protein
MFQELRDFFTVTLAKRLSSPFISTFLLAWCIANYDVVLLVFSGTEWQTKIVYIKSAFSFTVTSDYFFNVIWRFALPVGVSFFYILVWPEWDMYFYEKTKLSSIKYKNKQMELEGITPISQEERDNLYDELNKYKEESRKEIAEKEARISELENRNKASSAREAEFQKEIINLTDEIHSKDKELELNDLVGNETAKMPNSTINHEIDEQIKQEDELLREMKVPPENIESNESGEVIRQADEATRNITIPGMSAEEFNTKVKEEASKISDQKRNVIKEAALGDSIASKAVDTQVTSHSNVGLYRNKVANKYYNFTYTINDSVIKKIESTGGSLSKTQELNFTRDDITEEVYNNLLDVYYVESENDIGPDMHLFLRFADTEAENWESNLNPEKASVSEVLSEWSNGQSKWKNKAQKVVEKDKNEKVDEIITPKAKHVQIDELDPDEGLKIENINSPLTPLLLDAKFQTQKFEPYKLPRWLVESKGK